MPDPVTGRLGSTYVLRNQHPKEKWERTQDNSVCDLEGRLIRLECFPLGTERHALLFRGPGRQKKSTKRIV